MLSGKDDSNIASRIPERGVLVLVGNDHRLAGPVDLMERIVPVERSFVSGAVEL